MSIKKLFLNLESPGKISKFKKYLDQDYIVKASFGHIQMNIIIEKSY